MKNTENSDKYRILSNFLLVIFYKDGVRRWRPIDYERRDQTWSFHFYYVLRWAQAWGLRRENVFTISRDDFS